MPTARFTVTVTSRAEDSNAALLDVGRYLGYADRTDLFGYHAGIDESRTQLHDGQWFITVEFSAPVASEAELERWRSEMDQLARVEEYECITNPTIAQV